MSNIGSFNSSKLNYKGVFIILDGVGDRYCSDLKGQTPLEAAKTPVMDKLALKGITGMMDPLVPGLPVATHTGTGLLFGLPCSQAFNLCRGPVEAAGVGIEVLPGDICLRSNFAAVKQEQGFIKIIDRRAGRIKDNTHELAELLQNVKLGEGVRASLTPAKQHRGVLHLSGFGLSDQITDTDPGTRNLIAGVQKSQALSADNPEAIRTAAMLNRFVHIAHKKLSQSKINKRREQNGLLPANAIITRSAGQVQKLTSMVNYYGLRAALVAADSTAIGLGRLLDYSTIIKPEFNGLCTTDIKAKLEAVNQALEQHDLVFLHIKAPDVLSHDRKPLEKKKFLEEFDNVLKVLDDRLEKNELVITITGDHSTDSNTGRHIGDPVPSLIFHPAGRADHCSSYSEKACMTGGLGRIRSSSLLLSTLDAMGAISQYKMEDKILFT